MPKNVCIRCGDCCETFLMNDEFIERFRSFFQRSVLKESQYPNLEQTLIQTIDNKCVFLFPDNTCSIYKYRPEVCKMYGNPKYLECPKVSRDGKIRSEEEYNRIKAKNNDPSQWSKEYRKKLDESAKNRLKYVINKLKK